MVVTANTAIDLDEMRDVIVELKTNVQNIDRKRDIINIEPTFTAQVVFVESIKVDVILSRDNLRAVSLFDSSIKIDTILF